MVLNLLRFKAIRQNHENYAPRKFGAKCIWYSVIPGSVTCMLIGPWDICRAPAGALQISIIVLNFATTVGALIMRLSNSASKIDF